MKLGKKRNGTGNFFAWPSFFSFSTNESHQQIQKFHYFLSHLLAVSLFFNVFKSDARPPSFYQVLQTSAHPATLPHASAQAREQEKKTFHSQIKNQQKKISRFTGEICLSRQIFLEMIFFPRSRLCGGSFLQKE